VIITTKGLVLRGFLALIFSSTRKPLRLGEHHVQHDQVGLILLGQLDGRGLPS